MKFSCVFLLLMLSALAQQPPANNNANADQDNGDFKLSTTTNLIVEDVTVHDKSGNGVEGLTAKDFTVLEDGKPQEIKFFEYQKLPDDVQPLPADNSGNVTVLKKFPHTQIQPEAPGETRYRDKRLMVFYFDLTALPPADQLRAVEAARKFIRTQMTPADLVGIMVFRGQGVEVLQSFTSDRDKLQTIIETIAVGEAEGFDETDTSAAAADSGSAFGQDDSEFNLFNTDRQLAAVQTAVTMLGHLNEKKIMLYFSNGIKLNGTDNQAQMHATTNAAVRAGVTIWSIDSRGLVADAPMGDASKGSPGGQAMYSGAGALAFANNFQKSQDALYALSGDTGGKAFLDSNDLAAGIVKAQKSINSYYIVGYYTTNSAADGKFRRIKISVNQQNASLDFRQGYFAPKVFGKFTAADKDRQLEDALMMGDPITDLTIAMELNYFQLNRAEYFVPVSVKIPGSELARAKRRGAERTQIDFIGEIKDDFGTTVQNLRDKVDVKLTDEKAEELASKPILYNTGYTLLPGKYTIKVLARDAETGRLGTYINNFVIPNLNKEEKRIPISSVVLSSQRIPLSDALFNAKSKTNAEAVDPLIADGQRLLPSVTRVFHRNRELYVYLQAYERAATTTQPLVAFVTFYRGQTKAFETKPVPVLDGLDPKSKALPMRLTLPLDKLDPGEYNCQVTVLDPGSQKAAFWQAPVMLIQ